jgi:hypothetical protein
MPASPGGAQYWMALHDKGARSCPRQPASKAGSNQAASQGRQKAACSSRPGQQARQPATAELSHRSLSLCGCASVRGCAGPSVHSRQLHCRPAQLVSRRDAGRTIYMFMTITDLTPLISYYLSVPHSTAQNPRWSSRCLGSGGVHVRRECAGRTGPLLLDLWIPVGTHPPTAG